MALSARIFFVFWKTPASSMRLVWILSAMMNRCVYTSSRCDSAESSWQISLTGMLFGPTRLCGKRFCATLSVACRTGRISVGLESNSSFLTSFLCGAN
jgi:hypothetical protein